MISVRPARKAKIFKGTGGAGVVEIVDDHRGDTFRAVYTVRFASAVYVLHAFQKKSKTGIATAKGGYPHDRAAIARGGAPT